MTQTRRCLNTDCRVETYKGLPIVPFSACPVCLTLGPIVDGVIGAKDLSKYV